MKKTLLFALGVLAACLGPAVASEGTLIAGNSSGVTSFQKVEIRDQKAWTTLWRRHNGPNGAPPAVDFSREMVVGVFLGQRSSTGYSVDLEVKFVHHREYEVSVTEVIYREKAPAAGAFVMPAMSQPFALKIVRATTGVVFAEGRAKGSSADGKRAGAANLADMRDAVAALEAQEQSLGLGQRANMSLDAAKGRVLRMLESVRSGGVFPGFGNQEEAGASLLGTASSAENRIMLVGAKCTPGVDCPEEKPKRRARCTPGVDCPDEAPARRKPSCTPGVDCPGDGDSGGGERTPPPPNYRSRPGDEPPRHRRPGSSVPRYDRGVDTAGYWQVYRTGYFGFPVEEVGPWRQTEESFSINRGGSQTGLGQGTAFRGSLRSTTYRNVYRLYFRHVGRDCDPYDTSRCVDWDIEDAWFYEGKQNGQTQSVDVSVSFNQDKAMLPWERENFSVSYDGSRISLNQGETAYHYSVSGPIINQQTGMASIILTPGGKRLQAPEADKVNLHLAVDNGQLRLVVDDMRASYYAGEPLEIAVTVYREEKMSWRNPFGRDAAVFERAQNGPLQVKIDGGKSRQDSVGVSTSAAGKKHYIKSWSFRRANSKISRPDWMQRGQGNSIQY